MTSLQVVYAADYLPARARAFVTTLFADSAPCYAFAAEGDVNLTFIPEEVALRGERVDASFDASGQPTELLLRGNALVQQAGREIAAEAIDTRFGTGEDNETTLTSVLA